MRINVKPESKYPWYIRLSFFMQKKKFGKVLLPNFAWGRIPRLFFAMAFFFKAITSKKSQVSAIIKSLVMVRISQINDCPFCIDLNSALLLKQNQASISNEKLLAIANWRESDLFDEIEKVCLHYAETMTITGEKVTDDEFSQLKIHFNDDEIVELTATIAYQNLSSKFNHALDIESQAFCRIKIS